MAVSVEGPVGLLLPAVCRLGGGGRMDDVAPTSTREPQTRMAPSGWRPPAHPGAYFARLSAPRTITVPRPDIGFQRLRTGGQVSGVSAVSVRVHSCPRPSDWRWRFACLLACAQARPGASGETRTPTACRPLGPKPSASTSSATLAWVGNLPLAGENVTTAPFGCAGVAPVWTRLGHVRPQEPPRISFARVCAGSWRGCWARWAARPSMPSLTSRAPTGRGS